MDTDTVKKTPKISDYETHYESPFIVELNSKLYVPNPDHKSMKGDDGKMYGMYEIPKGKVILHDPHQYIKMFKGNSSLITELSGPASKMFYYICENIQSNKDDICIIKEDYFTFAGYKSDGRITYYRAIEGLLKATIIARKAGSTTCFFINPNILFNGDRTKLKNVIVKPPENSNHNFKVNR